MELAARPILLQTRRRNSKRRNFVARERRLEAHQVEAIFRAFAEVMRELPPDTEAGWLDAAGDLRLAPDIGRKLRTARSVRDLLRQMRESREEDEG
jgi:hypothetical protein